MFDGENRNSGRQLGSSGSIVGGTAGLREFSSPTHEKPPPSHVFQQVALIAAEERMDYC
jgi:hypothetical protein